MLDLDAIFATEKTTSPRPPATANKKPASAPDLLAVLESRGFRLRYLGERLFVDRTAGIELTQDDSALIRQHKAGLMEILKISAASKEAFPVDPADLTPEAMARDWKAYERMRAEWDAAKAKPWNSEETDKELRQAVETIAASDTAWLTPSQRNLLSIFKKLIQGFHARRDPQLWGAGVWIQEHVARWCRQHEEAVRKSAARQQ